MEDNVVEYSERTTLKQVIRPISVECVIVSLFLMPLKKMTGISQYLLPPRHCAPH